MPQNPVLKFLTNLPIGTKLPMVGLLFLFPIALFSYLLVTEKNEQIQFTQKEIAGLHYISGAYQALVAGTTPSPANTDYRSAAAELVGAEEADNGMCGVTDKTFSLIGTLRNAADGSSGDDVAPKAADLISALSDNSNITLDPDGDAYFVGDLVVNQATGMLIQINALLKAAHALDTQASDENKIAYAEARDGLVASAGFFQGDAGKAMKGNAGGTLRRSLGPDTDGIAAAVARVVAAARTTDRTALTAAGADLGAKTQAYVAKSNQQMELLLRARIAGFYDTIYLRLGIALGTVLLGALAFLAVLRTITRPLFDLIDLTGRLADGETGIEIPRTERKDEIGQLARALSVFAAGFKEKPARKPTVWSATAKGG